MITATFTELRNRAKTYFDRVEHGETIEVFRKGKPIAVLSPYRSARKGRWADFSPIKVPGVSASKMIIEERRRARF